MIVMINGAFGVGKSTTAELLQAALPNSMIYDPEEVGYMLRKINAGMRSLPEQTGDFQDIPIWRTLALSVAEALRQQYGRHLIVPMTLANVAYFRELRAGLAKLDANLYHFCLLASLETIHRRLEERGDAPGSWAAQQTVRCLLSLQSAEFQIHIDTERYLAEQVVEIILGSIQQG